VSVELSIGESAFICKIDFSAVGDDNSMWEDVQNFLHFNNQFLAFENISVQRLEPVVNQKVSQHKPR